MSRVIHIANARPGGAAHWLRVGVAVVIAVAAGVGLSHLLPEPVTRVAPAGPEAALSQALPRAPALALAASAEAEAAPAACAIQQMVIALGTGPQQTACLAATNVRQNGSMRSYIVAGGNEGWALQIDVAGGAVMKASLTARDGRRYGCEDAGCTGVGLGRHDARGVRSILLRELRLVRTDRIAGAAADTPAADAVVSARLQAPADEQVPGLACTGPSVAISTPDGAARKFCGQGGAGFEIADDGTRNYRFQDHEGQTLLIAVNAEQRVTRVEYGPYACSDSACSGASMTAPAPEREFSERSFFFGRTPLFDGKDASAGRGSPRLGMVLDGSLVLPAQE